MDRLASAVADSLEELVTKIRAKREQLVGSYNLMAVLYVSKKVGLSKVAEKVAQRHSNLVSEINEGAKEAEDLLAKVKAFHEDIVGLKEFFTDLTKENHKLVIRQVDLSFEVGVRADNLIERVRNIVEEANSEECDVQKILTSLVKKDAKAGIKVEDV